MGFSANKLWLQVVSRSAVGEVIQHKMETTKEKSNNSNKSQIAFIYSRYTTALSKTKWNDDIAKSGRDASLVRTAFVINRKPNWKLI